MQNQLKRTAADLADRDILRGPPGLLFGLTLLIFAAARLCFGWDTPPAPQEDPAAQTAAAQSEVEAPRLTRADFTDR